MLLDSAPRTWSSIEELHLQFCRVLVAHQTRPVLVFSEPLAEELTNRFRDSGAEIEAINYEDGIVNYYRQLRRLVRKHSIQTAHIGFFNYFHLIPWLARFAGMRQIVYQEHNSGVLEAKGPRRLLIRLRARFLTMPMTRVIAISQFVKRQLIEIGIPEQKIWLVHHGVDTRRFLPNPSARERWAQRFAIAPDELILSSVAHLRPFKHPEVIVEAIGLLVKRGVKARLFMAGAGEMRQELEQLSRRLGISDRIYWLGSCNNVENLLQASDIFVLASVGEAFGLVLTEAMACGVPVVGSRSGAIPEIVEDGITGLLATSQDSSSFADAIERLARDGKLRREMGQRGRERVQQDFTAEMSIQKVLRVYESMWNGVNPEQTQPTASAACAAACSKGTQ
jgi:glycosyltransferase involved in cell wall biosynthesis